MSRTLNTRPMKVIKADAEASAIKSFTKDPEAPDEKIHVVGGMNSEHGHGKRHRKSLTGKRRQQERRITHEAPLLDSDDVDVPPTKGSKRTVGWRK